MQISARTYILLCIVMMLAISSCKTLDSEHSSEGVDSSDPVFLKYRDPIVPEEVREYRRQLGDFGSLNMVIQAVIRTDTAGKVYSIEVREWREISSGGPITDSIWSYMKESIIEASKDWVVVPSSECLKYYVSEPACRRREVFLTFKFLLLDVDIITPPTTVFSLIR